VGSSSASGSLGVPDSIPPGLPVLASEVGGGVGAPPECHRGEVPLGGQRSVRA
jgi:hypothetical protein